MKPQNLSLCEGEFRLGLGCWAIGGHGWGKVDDTDSHAAISCAYDLGVRLFDTADCYGFGHSETILADALGSHRQDVVISTKGGVRWDNSGHVWKDNSSEYLRQAVHASLKRLKIDSIPLYFVHWPDGTTPVEEVMDLLAGLRSEGLVQAVGLSNFPLPELEKAMSEGPVDVIQVKANLIFRSDFLNLLPICRQAGTKIMAFGVLAEGMLTGKFKPDTIFPADDHRSKNPEFQGEEFRKKLEFVSGLEDLAKMMHMPVASLALAAILGQEGVGCTLFGARNASQVKQNVDCLALDLAPYQEQLSQLVTQFGFPPLHWQRS